MAASGASASIEVHCTIQDSKKGKFQCNYCGKVVSKMSRIKYHLGGIRGEVTPCTEVPADVKKLFLGKLCENKTMNKVVLNLATSETPLKRKRCPGMNSCTSSKSQSTESASSWKSEGMTSAPEDGSADLSLFSEEAGLWERTFSEGKEYRPSMQARLIGRFFYENGIDFNAVNSPSFQEMMTATVGNAHCEYDIPSYRELKGPILQEEVKEMRQYLQTVRQSWGTTGCSILLDGWIDEKGRTLVNFLADCPQGAIYLSSTDISSCVGDVDAFLSILNGVIEEVGGNNVIQIVAWSAEDWLENAGEKFIEKYKRAMWGVSASHCIELMLEKIGMVSSVKGVMKKAKTVVEFIHTHAPGLELTGSQTLGHELLKPHKIISAIPYMTLENMVSGKKKLREMFLSSGWSTSLLASSEEGKRVVDLISNPSFWHGARMVLKATVPLLRVLGFILGSDKPQAGYIYETMDQVKETIRSEFENNESRYMPFWKIIDGIWNAHLHSPLHAAGYYLNPSLFYASDFYFDAEVAFGLLCSIVLMVRDLDAQVVIALQIDKYRHAKGAFAEGSAVDKRNISPVDWWSRFGEECPQLQRFAIRVFSQTCDGSSRYGLKRDMAEKLLTGGRNRTDQERLRDLTFLSYNLQLQQFHSKLVRNNY
ncbi:hypothetical protein ACJRO7_025862 [Eucalyptus globulus]|uniref:DUF659 domain-containing protein n=1 Tax=Eucalyptus globulus TaxID=34317 RepID=A0ABD3KAE5_EUCGL